MAPGAGALRIFMTQLRYQGPRISITITIADTVPDDTFARIDRLTHSLQQNDHNFRGVTLQVQRGPLTEGARRWAKSWAPL